MFYQHALTMLELRWEPENTIDCGNMPTYTAIVDMHYVRLVNNTDGNWLILLDIVSLSRFGPQNDRSMNKR